MSKFLIPVLALLAAAGIFFVYMKPLVAEIDRLKVVETEFDTALEKARELDAAIERLQTQLDSYSPTELKQLETILPNKVRNLQLILDIDALAARHNIELDSISVNEISTPTSDLDKQRVAVSSVKFQVETNQSTFVQFLSDIEKSLQLLDASSIKFQSVTGKDVNTNDFIYDVTFKTYSLQ